jgi:hypothetical protein
MMCAKYLQIARIETNSGTGVGGFAGISRYFT